MTRPSEDQRAALIAAARAAREHAHCPYSKFAVGAALLTQGGTIVPGVNVENASLGLTICAERSAAVAAVSAGQREFVAIAIATSLGEPVQPCGACRQFLAEFGPGMLVLAVGDETVVETSLEELLPSRFELTED